MAGDKKDNRSFLQKIGIMKTGEPEDDYVEEKSNTNNSEVLYFDKNEKAEHFKDLEFVPVESTPEFNIKPDANAFNPYIEDTKKIYQQEFTKMNAPEIDFYEFYNSIQNIENKSTESFKMAFSMIKSMNPLLTKEILLSQADGYIKRIDDNYKSVKNKGITAKGQIVSEVSANSKLLQEEIQQLENTLKLKKDALSNLVANSDNKANELNLKLKANDVAYEELHSAITFVKDNLNQL